jgi:hypothetical protein
MNQLRNSTSHLGQSLRYPEKHLIKQETIQRIYFGVWLAALGWLSEKSKRYQNTCNIKIKILF